MPAANERMTHATTHATLKTETLGQAQRGRVRRDLPYLCKLDSCQYCGYLTAPQSEHLLHHGWLWGVLVLGEVITTRIPTPKRGTEKPCTQALNPEREILEALGAGGKRARDC